MPRDRLRDDALPLPPGEVHVPPGEVHVWWADLTRSGLAHELGLGPGLAGLPDVLSPDELARAARYRFARDRERFARARSFLRLALGRYLGTDPRSVEFAYGPRGKPSIAGQSHRHDRPDLRFNLSHSADLVLLAIGWGRDTGVDVERLRPDIEWDDLATRFFDPAEAEALRRLPPGDRARGFLTTWVRKEAYLKARGGGLALGLDRFTVPVGLPAPGSPLPLAVAGDQVESQRWHLQDLDPGQGYVAAVAVEMLPGVSPTPPRIVVLTQTSGT